MIPLIQNNIEEIKALCKQFHVAELYLFGSALSDNFRDDSDLDFAVLFDENISPLEQGDAYFDLLDELENLLNRKIDLVSYRVIKNPIFKEELDKTKVPLYAAA